ncbi:MAG: hypothetical protein V1743_03330 [Nanoarchaeota archaeon]
MDKQVSSIGILLLVLIVGFSAPAMALNTLVGESASLTASLLRYQPNPAEPGDVLDVYILLANSGSAPAKNVILEMKNNYPFSVDNSIDAVKEIPAIPGQETFLARFKVRIAKDADEGINYLKVTYKTRDSTVSKDQFLEVQVLTNDATIGIDKIDITPETVAPGGQATIDLYLKNKADSRLRDITVTLQTSKTIGSTTSLIPIAPLDGTFERRIIELSAAQEIVLSYNLIVEPGASSDVYKIPISVVFSDETGRKYNLSDQVGLIVNAQPFLTVYLDSITAYTDKLQGEFTLKFVNAGLAKIKLLTAEIGESNDFELISNSRKVYIGNIDSDDYETSQFSIKAKKSEFTIPVKLHYLDALNREYTVEENIPVKLFSSKEVANGVAKSKAGYYVIAIVIIVIAFFVYRKIRKNQKLKKSK